MWTFLIKATISIEENETFIILNRNVCAISVSKSIDFNKRTRVLFKF